MIKEFYFPITIKQLGNLFLAIVLPLHFWAIFVFILNAPTPENRNEWGDFFAILVYILLFTILECLILTAITAISGYFLPKRWGNLKIYSTLLGLIYLIIAWAAISQLLESIPIPENSFIAWVAINLTNTLKYRQIAWGIALGCAAIITLTLIFIIIKGEELPKFVSFVEKADILAYLYLALDVIGFVYVIFRI
jgi:hypothetical protein